MDALKAAARSLKRSAPSKSNSSDPIRYSPRCDRCADIVLGFPWWPADRGLSSYQDKVLQDIIRGYQVIDGSNKIVENGIAKGCCFCRMVKENQDTSAQFDTLGESPHLVAMFQDNSNSSSVINSTKGNVSLVLGGNNCIQAFTTKTGDFVLSVDGGKLQQFRLHLAYHCH